MLIAGGAAMYGQKEKDDPFSAARGIVLGLLLGGILWLLILGTIFLWKF